MPNRQKISIEEKVRIVQEYLKHNHMDCCTYDFLDFKGYIATDPSYP